MIVRKWRALATIANAQVYIRFFGQNVVPILKSVPGNRGVWQRDSARYNVMEEVFGPCAGAAAYRRGALEALAEGGQVLDEDLVMYCEDVDLNLRARLRGFRTIYVPRAIVYHRLSATGGGTLASYYCGRNFILVWVKNMPGALARESGIC